MKTILTVACEIPGGLGEYAEFNSRTSLLDADFVLFCPTLGRYDYSSEDYQGKPLLTDTSSFQLQGAISHWRKELSDFLNAGKTIFMILSDFEQVYVMTGKKQYSGTGRNRQTTHLVRPLSNYDLLPFPAEIVESKGTLMLLQSGESLLREYWQQFGAESEYYVHIEKSDLLRPHVFTRHGGRIVGGIFRNKSGGALVVLPWVDFYRQEFFSGKREDEDGEDTDDDVEEKQTWTPKAIEWGEKYLKTLESLDNTIRSQSETTPIPQWAQDDKFRTNQETALSVELVQIQTKISDLEKKREKVEEQLANAGSLKRLLFEQGHALENAILEAMRLMGFVAKTYRDSDFEFDVVLECSEGRYIGEVEGRDSKPISIDKMRQLEVNIHEDLSRDEVSDPAKGILFGNAYRLSPPSDRPAEHFTAKCMKAAERNGTVLIRTCDLFEVAKALVDKPDAEFAALCRKAILNTVGKEVRFPVPPEAESGSTK